MRRVCVEPVRVHGTAAAVSVIGGWGSKDGASPLGGCNSTAPSCYSPSSTTIYTPRRCASTVSGGGRGNTTFLQKLKDFYRDFQLLQDRKLDAAAAEEAREGQQRDDPRHLSSSDRRSSSSSVHPRESQFISCNPNLCPRSVLFVPGSKPRAMEKITNLNADCYILDLEDSVGVSSKRQARENVRHFVQDVQKKRRIHRDAQVSDTVNAILQKRARKADDGVASTAVADRLDLYPRLIVRINSPDFDPATAMLDLELVGLLGPAIEGVAIPKTTPRTYSLIKDYIHPNHQLWAFFESPKSVIQAPIICKQQVYQYAVMGYNDLSGELQLPMMTDPLSGDGGFSESVRESLHIAARLPLWQSTIQVLQAARAYDMFVLDAVFNDPTDKVGFRRSLQECKALGLNGKTLIHPSQIEPTNAAYTPSATEVAWATRIIEAMQKAQGGVATVDGKMVEELHKRQANRLLALYRSTESEKQKRARRAAEKAKAGETDNLGEENAVDDAREPRRTPSRHRPVS